MEYISTEEFLKQPKEVQKVFINWWQPKSFDLIHIDYYSVNSIDTVISEKDIKTYGIEFFPNGIDGDVIPLFTEGQLRKFIEDKTRYKVEVPWHGCYDIYLVDQLTGEEVIKDYFNLGTDLLQAYWKVACEIAKEKVEI